VGVGVGVVVTTAVEDVSVERLVEDDGTAEGLELDEGAMDVVVRGVVVVVELARAKQSVTG